MRHLITHSFQITKGGEEYRRVRRQIPMIQSRYQLVATNALCTWYVDVFNTLLPLLLVNGLVSISHLMDIVGQPGANRGQ